MASPLTVHYQDSESQSNQRDLADEKDNRAYDDHVGIAQHEGSDADVDEVERIGRRLRAEVVSSSIEGSLLFSCWVPRLYRSS